MHPAHRLSLLNRKAVCVQKSSRAALGLRLAIDDFGTGYSSLNYLTSFPVDRIKIAQELIFNCTTETRCAAVVRAAIHLSEELDTEVLAEGVESAEHARFL